MLKGSDLSLETIVVSQTDWDARYLEMARLVSTWSKDPNAQVGAVIVRKNRVVATGFNGLPSDVLDTANRINDPDLKLSMMVHAEENALIVAGRDAEGACIYVHGKPICCRCAGYTIQAGITRVVAMSPQSESIHMESKWRSFGLLACEMFDEAGIAFLAKELKPAAYNAITKEANVLLHIRQK